MTVSQGRVRRFGRLAAAAAAAALLAGCEPAKQEFGQCAPGVDEIGRVTTVLPPGC